MLSDFRFEKVLAGLVFLTVVALVGERRILEINKVIGPSDGYRTSVYSDGLIDRGDSEAETLDADAFEWRCTLGQKHPYPYCGFEVILDPGRVDGLDLRSYDKVRIFLDYHGPAESIRFYLRNSDPVYSTPEKPDTTKYNQVEFPTDMLNDGRVDLDMADFFVANWWFQRYRVSPKLTHPQFDNIVVIEVQTGNDPPAGEYQFKLNGIELTGQRISTQHWYRFILGFWLAIALLFISVRILALNKELQKRQRRERELMEVNVLLDMRSKTLEEMTKTDPLTGAFNRQGIEDALKIGLVEWRSERRPLSILMLDVDHFKNINDTHGHAVGDNVLTDLVALVQKNIRSNDLFARWGGEEFVVVCRNTSTQHARALAEKLRRLIERHQHVDGVEVTVSIGIAVLREQESLDQLFIRADKALYEAKGSGRNRIVVAGRPDCDSNLDVAQH